ncbi:unnamed protein product [Effrenium voratum]|uniref:F-box domain-containing protein n=1 Tax=Effrenium voratum TaxID=2562239 RepID=A0AA36INK7_9DINO|nr:unnamed protein product [Effrenium voratum]CAJ1412512.1 unnamed protein product [Effrenium voratum]
MGTSPEWLSTRVFMLLEERQRLQLALVSKAVYKLAELEILRWIVHGLPLEKHHLVVEALNGRLSGGHSALRLCRCMERISRQVAVSGSMTTCGIISAQYSGRIAFGDGTVDIELKSILQTVEDCGEEATGDVVHIEGQWNLDDDQVCAWNEQKGLGVNDWVGHFDVFACSLFLRNHVGSEITLSLLAPDKKPPPLASWLESIFNLGGILTLPSVMFQAIALGGPAAGPLFLALGAC